MPPVDWRLDSFFLSDEETELFSLIVMPSLALTRPVMSTLNSAEAHDLRIRILLRLLASLSGSLGSLLSLFNDEAMERLEELRSIGISLRDLCFSLSSPTREIGNSVAASAAIISFILSSGVGKRFSASWKLCGYRCYITSQFCGGFISNTNFQQRGRQFVQRYSASQNLYPRIIRIYATTSSKMQFCMMRTSARPIASLARRPHLRGGTLALVLCSFYL